MGKEKMEEGGEWEEDKMGEVRKEEEGGRRGRGRMGRVVVDGKGRKWGKKGGEEGFHLKPKPAGQAHNPAALALQCCSTESQNRA